MRRLSLILALMLIVPVANADTVLCHNDRIEYTTFLSTIIPAKVAEAHGIVRSNKRLIANVTVLHDGKASRARITGTATNLMNQVTTLEFREVREGDAIYYLASLVVTPRDTVRFDISVRPAGSAQSCRIEFTRDYYREGPS